MEPDRHCEAPADHGSTAQGDAVAEHLYLAARHHSDTARALRDSSDRHERTDAAIHAGAAVELLSKALLAAVDVRLLSDGRATSHALLELIAEREATGSLGVSPRLPSKSLMAGPALELASRLNAKVSGARSAGGRVLQARNAAAHMAELDDAELANTINDMETFAAAAVGALGRQAIEFLGASRFADWTAEQERRRQAAEAAVSEKVTAAKDAYHHLTNGLPEEKLKELNGLLTSRVFQKLGDDGWEVECPACEYGDAWLSWEADYDYDYDGSVVGGVRLLGLDCPRCGLQLDGDEVEAAGLDTDDYREPPDYDAYFEPSDYRD